MPAINRLFSPESFQLYESLLMGPNRLGYPRINPKVPSPVTRRALLTRSGNNPSETKSYARHSQFLTRRMTNYCACQTFGLFSLGVVFSSIAPPPSLFLALLLGFCLTNFGYILLPLASLYTTLDLYIHSFDWPFVPCFH